MSDYLASVRKIARQWLTKPARPARRLAARPFLECLEDRTVTTATSISSADLLVTLPVPSQPASASPWTGNGAQEAVRNAIEVTGLRGPGLGRLLEDVQRLGSPASQRSGFQLVADVTGRPNLPFGDQDANRTEQREAAATAEGARTRSLRQRTPKPATDSAPTPKPAPGTSERSTRSGQGETDRGPARQAATNTPGQTNPRGQPTSAAVSPIRLAPPSRASQDVPEGAQAKAQKTQGLASGAAPQVRIRGSQLHVGEVSDGTLLQRFVVHREQAAFTALVQRHEHVVFGVCQRVLRDVHAAQDAQQATFLVLARKASVLDDRGSLEGWLYRVAYHLALRLRGVSARRRRREREHGDQRPTPEVATTASNVEDEELRQALRLELERLPEKHRDPIILCYFDGRTHEEAARLLGMARGSMAKRLGEGLDLLRERLHQRGYDL